MYIKIASICIFVMLQNTFTYFFHKKKSYNCIYSETTPCQYIYIVIQYKGSISE